MLVKLKRSWFGPTGVRYRALDRFRQPWFQPIDDELLAVLPSDALVQHEGEVVRADELRKRKPVPAKAPIVKEE